MLRENRAGGNIRLPARRTGGIRAFAVITIARRLCPDRLRPAVRTSRVWSVAVRSWRESINAGCRRHARASRGELRSRVTAVRPARSTHTITRLPVADRRIALIIHLFCLNTFPLFSLLNYLTLMFVFRFFSKHSFCTVLTVKEKNRTFSPHTNETS